MLPPLVTASIGLVENPRTNRGIAAQIEDLLVEVDNEFVPPLSWRDSATVRDSAVVIDGVRPDWYVRQALARPCLVAFQENEFAGFMSFLPQHDEPNLDCNNLSTYVVTVATHRRFRRQGVARTLYRAAFALPAEFASPFITTRTWSANVVHIGLLERLDFHEVKRLKDDRGVGIDTVYYARALDVAD